MMTVLRWLIVISWIIIIALLFYLYFFRPEIFNHLFQYPGAGSPYVNTPTGT